MEIFFFPLNWIFNLFLLQGKSIAIFYGSQTGTAEEFAGRLAKDAQRYGLKALVLDPEECDMVSEVVYNNLRSQDLDMFENLL